jgi:hypothetical protein
MLKYLPTSFPYNDEAFPSNSPSWKCKNKLGVTQALN